MAPRVTREEFNFVMGFDNVDDFRRAYVEKYKNVVPIMSIAKRSYSIWRRREDLKVLFAKADALALEKAHTVLIPANIKTKSPNNKRADPFPDVGEVLVKCCNLLAEIASVQKEQLELFRSLSSKKG